MPICGSKARSRSTSHPPCTTMRAFRAPGANGPEDQRRRPQKLPHHDCESVARRDAAEIDAIRKIDQPGEGSALSSGCAQSGKSGRGMIMPESSVTNAASITTTPSAFTVHIKAMFISVDRAQLSSSAQTMTAAKARPPAGVGGLQPPTAQPDQRQHETWREWSWARRAEWWGGAHAMSEQTTGCRGRWTAQS